MRTPAPVVLRGPLYIRVATLVVGLFVGALGLVLMLRANLGLSPWDVFHQGIARTADISLGVALATVGFVVLVAAWRLGARVGIGTLANATLVGGFVELLLVSDAVPDLPAGDLPSRVTFLVSGIVAFAGGTALYIGVGLGAGPRDSLMLVAATRSGWRLGAVRAAIELAALGVGYALGGDVGAGTVLFAVGIGPCVELAFALLRRSPLAQPAGPQ